MSSASPPWVLEGYDFPPVGSKVAPAIVCAVFYFITALVNIAFMKRSGYKPAMGMAVACIFRGVSLSLKAKSAADGGTSTVNAIMYGFLLGAGFGIAIAIQILAVAGWFKNTAPGANLPPRGQLWRALSLALFPLVIVFGPIIGLAGALEGFVDPTPDRAETAAQLRKASSAGMLSVVSIILIFVCGASGNAALKSGMTRAGGKLAPHAAILAVVPSLLLLLWSAAYRLSSNSTHMELQLNETYFYCLQVLPEMLQAILYTAGPTTRVHLSTNFSQWWQDIGSVGMHKAGTPAPPRPLAAWFDDVDPTLDMPATATVTALETMELAEPHYKSQPALLNV